MLWKNWSFVVIIILSLLVDELIKIISRALTLMHFLQYCPRLFARAIPVFRKIQLTRG